VNDKIRVEVTPQAWMELYQIMYRLTGEMAQWSDKHNLPVQISMGSLIGIYEVIADTANACDCDECQHVEDTFADELKSRMMDTSGTVH
jgi:hypothetical protein